MSIDIMSAIFKTEFRDLPLGEDGRMAKASSLKLVLLAIADHANDEGESSYPGLTKLQKKTALSRQGLVDVIKACKYNGLLTVSDQPSKFKTNNYTINLRSFPCLADKEDERLLVNPLDQSSDLTSNSQAALPEVVKPLDLNHPLTTPQPSSEKKFQKDKDDGLGGYLDLLSKGAEVEQEINGIKELLEVELHYNFPSSTKAQQVYKRIARAGTKGESIAKFIAWVKSDEKRMSYAWVYAKDPETIWRDWPQAFSVSGNSAKPDESWKSESWRDAVGA